MVTLAADARLLSGRGGDMGLRDSLLSALVNAFPDHDLRTSDSPDPVAVFHAACPEVGELLIYGDDDEAIIEIGNITHGHFSIYDETMGLDARHCAISEEVVGFLRELFADKVLLWTLGKGRSGGWSMPFEGRVPSDVPSEAKVFVWSGRPRLPG